MTHAERHLAVAGLCGVIVAAGFVGAGLFALAFVVGVVGLSVFDHRVGANRRAERARRERLKASARRG